MAEIGDDWDNNPCNAQDCPACKGDDDNCEYCGGSGEVSPSTRRSIIAELKETPDWWNDLYTDGMGNCFSDADPGL